MEHTKATPPPWSVKVEYDGDLGLSITIPEIDRMLNDSDWADHGDWERDLAHARLIVQAVNSYSDLLAACKAALEKVRDQKTYGQLDAAISKAEGKS
jgi:hypothetical protein